jgi:hypothetical protein
MNMLAILIILHLELSVALFREEWGTSNNEVDLLCRAQVRTVFIIYDIYCYWSSLWELIYFFGYNFLQLIFVVLYVVNLYLNAGPQNQMLL